MGTHIQLDSEAGTFSSYLAVPESGRGPGILLMHAWWGLNDFLRGLADRMAAEGFVVLAPDLYAGEVASTIEDAERLSNQLDYKQAIKHEVAAANYLLSNEAVQQDSIGVAGFSLGAGYAAWLATLRADVSAVVLFYGGVDQDAEYATETNAAFLGHFASEDPYESTESIQLMEEQLRSAGRQVEFYTYPGTTHWFFENDRPEYSPEAATLAWRRTIAFLHSQLGPKR